MFKKIVFKIRKNSYFTFKKCVVYTFERVFPTFSIFPGERDFFVEKPYISCLKNVYWAGKFLVGF